MLEGDNAYYCERCDKKVDTLKRCCIKKLPNILILSLKRFEFDLETLSRYKLNSYCEFYDDLDMREYCQESLAKKELLKKMQDEKLTYDMLNEDQKTVHDSNLPNIYYKYKLKGTVVHYGTADGGHYYSFIKERGTDKWFEFNDTTVRDYDPADLPEDTFGGKLKHERKIIQSGKTYIETEKLNNAYILIYEREQFIDNEKLFDLRESGRVDLNIAIPSYSLESKPLEIEKDIHEELLNSFDQHWISHKMFDEFFLHSMTEMCLKSSTLLQLNTERAMKHAMDIDESDGELQKLKFATLFILGVVVRAEGSIHHAAAILPQLRDVASRNLDFAKWILSCFTRKHTINELCASCWSAAGSRMISGLLKTAIRKVYSEESKDVKTIVEAIIKAQDKGIEESAQCLITLMNDKNPEMPLTLKCLYEFIVVTMSKVDGQEINATAQFMFLAVLHEFAIISADFRYIMISFKLHNL